MIEHHMPLILRHSISKANIGCSPLAPEGGNMTHFAKKNNINQQKQETKNTFLQLPRWKNLYKPSRFFLTVFSLPPDVQTSRSPGLPGSANLAMVPKITFEATCDQSEKKKLQRTLGSWLSSMFFFFF